MGKIISSTELNSTLILNECTDGFWLYDKTQGMNLAMRAKSTTEAFVKALSYYQDSLSNIQTVYHELRLRVDAFIEPFLDQKYEEF